MIRTYQNRQLRAATLFARIGTALYGERFIRPLAAGLDVDTRTVGDKL